MTGKKKKIILKIAVCSFLSVVRKCSASQLDDKIVLKYFPIVANHLVQSFTRFAGASYGRYVNVRSGTVGDR